MPKLHLYFIGIFIKFKRLDTCCIQYIKGFTQNSVLAIGKFTLEFKILRYLVWNYKDEELTKKYFLCSLDSNRYEFIEKTDIYYLCHNVDYDIFEAKNKNTLLRGPPLEKPYKSRIYGLIHFPRIFNLIQHEIKGITYVELITCSYFSSPISNNLASKRILRSDSISLMTDTEAMSSTSNNSSDSKTLSNDNTIYFSNNSSLSYSQEFSCTSWQKLRLDEISKLVNSCKDELRECEGYPYLYELYKNCGKEEIYLLAEILNDVLSKLTKNANSQKEIKIPLKSCMKKRPFEIHYDENMVEKAKKNAMKRVTKKDLERRENYVKDTVKRENENFEIEMRFLNLSPVMEKETRVTMCKEPSYLKFLNPLEVMKESIFEKRVEKMEIPENNEENCNIKEESILKEFDENIEENEEKNELENDSMEN